MHQFQRIGIFFIKVNAGNTGVMDLLKELLHVSPTLVIYPCVREKTASITTFKYTDTEINVFPETHFGESSQSFIHFATDSHIEATRIKFIHFLLSTTNTSRCKEGSHWIIDGFLNIRERVVCTVRAAKRISRSQQLFLYGIKISFGQNDIRVQYYEIFAFTSLCSVVTSLPRSGICFREVLNVQSICISVYDFPTRDRRTIFHYHNLKIFKVLWRETLQ